jgi:hypothetical protein
MSRCVRSAASPVIPNRCCPNGRGDSRRRGHRRRRFRRNQAVKLQDPPRDAQGSAAPVAANT